MPEAKTKDHISTSGGVLNLSDPYNTKEAGVSSYLMSVPNDKTSENSVTVDSPLNLVVNPTHSNETMGLKYAPAVVTTKTPLITPKPTTDTFPDSITVPTHPANKINYFPKTVPNFQGLPVTGHFLQRIGPFQYNPTSSGTPLVAFVNPTATSMIPHGLKPVFTAPSSIPSVETMNQIVYTSMSSNKTNVTPHPPTPVILVRSSTPLSRPGNFQYVMAPTEKSNMGFSKPASQAIFGNESGKFIPVATIVPNNASLVTDSQKTVTSSLSGGSTLTTHDLKYPEQNESKKITHSSSLGSKSTSQNLSSSWYQNMNNSMVLQQSSSDNMRGIKLDSGFSMPQPLNLTLQPSSGCNKKPSHKDAHFTDICKQKYPSTKPSLSPKLFFHSTSASSSSILINPAAYTLPNQNVSVSTLSHFNLQTGLSNNPTFGNNTPPPTPPHLKSYLESSQRSSIDLSKSRNISSPPTIEITEKKGHNMSYDEPPMTLKIDSIYSLADKPPEPAQPVDSQKQPSKTKVKNTTKLVKEKKKVIVKKRINFSKSRKRQAQKNAKPPAQKHLKPTYKRSNSQLEIARSILKRKIPAQKSSITVSCHANDFKSLHPISEEEKKLNTFFRYLGLCRSSSISTNDAFNNNGVHLRPDGSADGQCNVSKELARCFSCYLVVPMFIAPKNFTAMDINDPPESFKIQDKCSKECRHAFLNKQHATTGIVPRNGELDSCWKIIPQKPKCPHARKKYCRKSKTKASGNLTGSHCRRVGCIGCSTKKPTTTYNKIKCFRKNSKDNTTSIPSIEKEQTFLPNKQSGKKIYTFNKKLPHTGNNGKDGKKKTVEKDNACMNVLGENNLPALRKRKTNQNRHNSAKVLKKDVAAEVENVMGNGDIIEPESVDEISPFESNFLEIEDFGYAEDSLMSIKKIVKPEPIVSPQVDISASSERIQRLREILKEKQKDLELARQLLL